MSNNNKPKGKAIAKTKNFLSFKSNHAVIKSNDQLSSINIAAIFIAAAWSGFFVMGIELLGGRLLSPFFGSSIFVWGGIITVFMACLSIGYLIGGRMSKWTLSLKILGTLLFMEALFAIPIVAMGDSILEIISFYLDDARYGSVVGSLLMFGAPTVISGMVSPYAVRLLITDVHNSGSAAGRLYFTSTIGSAFGTILTSFYLVLYFEINTIIEIYIAISAVVGTWLLILARPPNYKNGKNA